MVLIYWMSSEKSRLNWLLNRLLLLMRMKKKTMNADVMFLILTLTVTIITLNINNIQLTTIIINKDITEQKREIMYSVN